MRNVVQKLSSWLSQRAFARAERRGRIDSNTAFFQVGPTMWRFVDCGKCIDFYCEVSRGVISIDLRPISRWSHATHARFSPDISALNHPDELSPAAQQVLIERIGRLPWVQRVVVL